MFWIILIGLLTVITGLLMALKYLISPKADTGTEADTNSVSPMVFWLYVRVAASVILLALCYVWLSEG